jgi:hypothetical protein
VYEGFHLTPLKLGPTGGALGTDHGTDGNARCAGQANERARRAETANAIPSPGKVKVASTKSGHVCEPAGLGYFGPVGVAVQQRKSTDDCGTWHDR